MQPLLHVCVAGCWIQDAAAAAAAAAAADIIHMHLTLVERDLSCVHYTRHCLARVCYQIWLNGQSA